MTLKIIHKNNTSAGEAPAPSDLDIGEIAVNSADAKLYIEDNDGTIQSFTNDNDALTTLEFTQSGTGAAARNLESKLKDVVSVKDFGAVGNGTDDDTAAFAAAFAALNAATKPTSLYIPSGNYLVDPGTCVITTSYRSVVGDGHSSRIIIPAYGKGIRVEGQSNSVHLTNVCISNLSVVASGWTGWDNSNAIAVNKADKSSVCNCFVEGDPSGRSWEQGIVFRDTNNGLISNNIVQSVSGNGISLDIIIGSEITAGNLVTGNTINNVGDAGIGFHNNVRYSAAVGNTINQPGQGGGTGIDVAGCNNCLFEGNVISNSGQYGIRLLQNLTYRTVDNVVTGNTVYHPSTAGLYAAISINNTERNTITNNKIIGNTSTLPDRGIYVSYSSTGTSTHPVTGEALYKLRNTVIKDNIIERFTRGVYFDASGGVTGATLKLDGNVFNFCTTGISFTTASSEIRFTTYGHNKYFNCTANVSSLTGGIVRNGDPLSQLMTTIPTNVSTAGVETTVTSVDLPAINGANDVLLGFHRVSEFGAYDGRIRYKDSAGTTLATEVFAEVTNVLRSLTVPFTSSGLLVVTIDKKGAGPFTGSVTCNGLYLEKRTYY